jgi:thioredoxin-related protein
VDALPATILLDRGGQLYTRLNGFLDKNHFADLLTERIRDALASAGESRPQENR